MRHEIDPLLRAWLDEYAIKQHRPTLTTLLQNLSVKIIDEKTTLNAWAWRRPGYEPMHIVTVWAEEVQVDDQTRWKTEISLDPSDDPHYNSDQKERERERIEILKELAATKRDCKVILMVNLRSREELARGVSSKAQTRVLDDTLWHTEFPDGERRGILRRGPRLPIEPNSSPGAKENEIDIRSVEVPSGLRFPDQELRDRVERAAVDHVIKEFSLRGRVENVEAQNLGYDLAVFDGTTGELKYKVEVKGTSGEKEVFFLTRNEYREACEDPERWRLVVVVNALQAPDLQEYRAREMERMFEKAPLVWHCSRKGSSADTDD